MRTETIEIYKFSELSDKAKEVAICKTREGEFYLDYPWYEGIIEDWEVKLGKMGFIEPEVSFSGFYSQGDGASFTCKSLDTNKLITNKRLLNCLQSGKIKVLGGIRRYNHRYVHENSTTFDFDVSGCGYLTDLNNIKEAIENELDSIDIVSINKDIYKDLESTYDYLNSGEAISEHLEANEYDFLIGGTKY